MKKILCAPVALILLAAAIPAHAGLIINATFDSNLTTAEKTTITSAINVYESLFSNSITVGIYFQGVSSGLGASSYYVYNDSYGTYYTGLIANNANPTAIADLNANGGNANTNGGNNPVTGTGSIELKSASTRVVDPTGSLGLSHAPECQLKGSSGSFACGGVTGTAYDGLISLNTGLTNPGSGNYSLLAVSEHEIDEILGLGSALENISSTTNATYNSTFYSNTPAPEDLWRFASNGTTRSFSTNCATPTAAYFFLNASTQVTQFNNACNGADFGDWAGGATPQVQDAFGTSGSTPTLGVSEIDALTAIGYTLTSAVPEPSTWVLLASSLGVLGLVKRRRNA